jgi:phenylalanyl-tRNA synthetase alpha chain
VSQSLPEIQYLVLVELGRLTEPISVQALAERMSRDQSPLSAAIVSLADAGHLQVEEEVHEEFRVGARANPYLSEGFPERQVLRVLAPEERPLALPEVARRSGLTSKEVGQSLRWLSRRGWAVKEGKNLQVTTPGREAVDHLDPDEALLERLHRQGPARVDELEAEGFPLPAARQLLAGRTGFLDARRRTIRRVLLTESGRRLLDEGVSPRRQVNQLTADLLIGGGWREVDLRPYDVTLEAGRLVPGKEHPFQRVIQQTRRVFLEMGFREIASPWVESAFWDFDALFQPQDHPARDMQDTFYVARPPRARLPEEELVERVRRTHEDGGETGSLGWRYRWERSRSEATVLRTHTTAATIRALRAHPDPPGRFFCVGPVFRRETIDYKHLPVFNQVDGIIVDRDATLGALLGTLSAFYRKMGFERFQFRPAFFPYTEPSVEVFVYLKSRGDWVELGGSGIFRPEVTEPLGCRTPVLAWGLGLERLALFRYGLTDIRELYLAHLEWLKGVPLCRS